MTNERSHVESSANYKPWFDITLLILAHLLLLPVWLLTWTVIPLLIWLGDRGPVFYKQARIGKNGQVFIVRKFRTMVPDAEVKGAAWTVDNDPRITRVGRVLRRTALDELPEIINILRREMSFVGPRALDVAEHRSLEKLVPGFASRLQVLPGLTGLAQIYDSTDDAHDKLRFDSEYINNMSLWLDMKLLILSIRNTIAGKWDQRHGKASAYIEQNPVIWPDNTNPDKVDEIHAKSGSKR